jgi:hypothetical protein
MRPRIHAVLLVGLLVPSLLHSSDYTAFSLKEAQSQLKAGSRGTSLIQLGGITRLAGMVIDSAGKDVILVGEREPNASPLELDDLVVGMRALMLHNEWPLVSLDNTVDTKTTRRQKVRFEGSISNTQLGKRLLEADIILKELALGKRSGAVWGVKSYADLCEEAASRGDKSDASVLFWFFPMNSRLIEREGVFVVGGFEVGTRTQLIGAKDVRPGQPKTKDELGERFAQDMTAAFRDLSAQFPQLRRVSQLYSAVALAHGLREAKGLPDLKYFLNDYPAKRVETPPDMEVMTSAGATMNLTGGIELRALLLRLQDGDVTALREAVLRSRPKGTPLSWALPLSSWQIVGANEGEATAGQNEPIEQSSQFGQLGVSINRQASFAGLDTKAMWAVPSPPKFQEMPSVLRSASMPRQIETPQVGGVMLSGSAKVVGQDKVGSTSGQLFSLVAAGDGAVLTRRTYRQFVTALWSVYYSKEDPGISIDPIGWGVDKQLVRYIGRVVNTDLGRVMREADYTMKKWAVGTERPDIPGFRDVDTISGLKGTTYADAFRRFWFVPTNMTFKASDNVLLFDTGKVVLKTEFMIQDKSTKAADPDLEFADFFTQRYDEISRKYPIFTELFEYAKLVSLAKYLKEQEIPLQWFLLGNLDQVLTEDSKGAVDTLSKGSQFLKDFRIEGGVEMPGRYVLDQTAAKAIQEATARIAPQLNSKTDSGQAEPRQPLGVAERSFEFDKRHYSVLPQHSFSSGKDPHGVRYQTDIALKRSGESGLELVRYFSSSSNDELTSADFGKGWKLLIPFRAFPLGAPTKQVGNVVVTEKWLIKNLVNGRQEVLTFDEKNYALAGYRPANLTNSQFLGMFWTGGGFLRLGDKIGNEFWFDGSGVLREMHFSEDYGVRFEYDYEETARDTFREAPYLLTTVGTNVQPGYTVDLPSQLKLTERATGHSETFQFGTNRNDLVGYISDNIVRVQPRFIGLRRDGVLIVNDSSGSELWFDLETRRFLKQRAAVVKRLVQGKYHWNDAQKDLEFVENNSVQFNQEFADGKFIVKSAQLFKKGTPAPVLTLNYQYTGDWMLAKVTSSERKEARTESGKRYAAGGPAKQTQ